MLRREEGGYEANKVRASCVHLIGFLALMVAGSAVAMPPRDASKHMKDPDKPSAVGVEAIRNSIAPGNAPGGAGLRVAPGVAPGPRMDNILTILVEFAGSDTLDGTLYTGPLHNQIDPPAPDDNVNYWIPDFNVSHLPAGLVRQGGGVK